MNAIEITNLSKTYKGKKSTRVHAVKDLSLTISEGEVFGFLGPNGAGKSTTIKVIMGLIRPSGGSVSIKGISASSHLSRQQVGYLPENPSFYDYLNADEYLELVGKIFGMDRNTLREKKDDVLTLLELKGALKRPIRSYSKGMVQRLGLAQVLIHDPDVYILDEPMSGLDPLGRALVKKVILELKARGKCVFFSTHITDDVEAVCDRVGIIVRGTLQRVERLERILTEGILGYHVLMRDKGSGGHKEVYLPKEDISNFMAQAHASGQEITLIEPKRKNLEEFFLGIVKGNNAE